MDYSSLRETLRTPQWSEAQDRILLEPYTYISANPGKEVRTKLIDAFNAWLDVPDTDLEVIRRIVRMLHNASLLMDDVEDSSELRRGIPVAHQIYGVPQTINTANYVYFLAVEELLALRRPSRAGSPAGESARETDVMGGTGGMGGSCGPGGSSGQSRAGGTPGSVAGAGAIGTASIDMAGTAAASSSSPDSGPSPKSRDTDHANIHANVHASGNAKGKQKQVDLVGTVTDELLSLHRGQGLDLFWRDSLTCPTEEEYVHMVLGKTGGLFRIAIKLMMAKSASEVDYVPLVNLISVFFQIRDDYMNLHSNEYEDNKGFAEDLTEGKFSFPIVHGVRADPSNRQILNVLQKRTTSRSLKLHTVNYLRTHTRSFEYTRGVLETLRKQIEEEIRSLGGNRMLEKILEALGVPAEK